MKKIVSIFTLKYYSAFIRLNYRKKNTVQPKNVCKFYFRFYCYQLTDVTVIKVLLLKKL